MSPSAEDLEYMRRALSLAARGAGHVSPNPLVGAVIVRDGRVIGEGWHAMFGGPHAERNALANCTESPRGATIYVTLEPCCHHGKTPPCTDALIEQGLARVIVGSSDPNPLVAGKGVRILREHGIEVVENVLKDECDRLNAPFFHYIRNKTPFVVLKYAMTMDGKIATRTGASQWITGEVAREQVHCDRNRYTAIMVGVGTVLADDPMLTCRIPGGRDPIRIVCDSRLSTPPSARLVESAGSLTTILATCCTDPDRHVPYLAAGCEILTVRADADGHVDLAALMQALGARGIDSIVLEGGGTLAWAALRAGIVHRVQAYIAPKLFGGAQAKTPVQGVGVAYPNDAVRLSAPRVTQLDDDLLLESEVIVCLQES